MDEVLNPTPISFADKIYDCPQVYIFLLFNGVFFWKLLYFWKQKTRKTYFGGYLEIAYDPTVSAKTPIKVTRTFSLLANGKNITVSHRIFCKIKVDSQIENKLVACMRQVFVWPVDLHTVRFWLIYFHLLTKYTPFLLNSHIYK